ncbi:SIR2 family protein [Bacillus sp. AL-1R]
MVFHSEYQIKKVSNIATDLIGNKIVFFIGAGFSRDLGYPGWGELLKEIITENNLLDKIKNSSLFYLISNQVHSDYEKINQLMLENLIGVDFLRLAGYVDILLKQEGKQDIQSEIRKKIIQYEDKRINNSYKYKEYSEAFNSFGDYINEIITTNYDTNLEYCIEKVSVIHRNLESINHKNIRNLKRNIKLYKIHGCVTDEDNGIIITEKNYQEFNTSNKYIFYKLYSTFMENNIVFLGYSLSDPNIRSLLSEVIDQIKGNQLEKKKIYWVNRGQINKIDRLFYESIYSMQIIDEIEILDFFNLLIRLVQTKWNDLEQVEVHWEKVAEELISRTSLGQAEYIDLINKVIESEKLDQVLSHIFNSFVVEESVRKEADKAFFMLLSRSGNEIITTFEPKLTDILSVEDNHLLAIIDLLQIDDKVNELFVERGYSKILLESLVSRAKTINDFYLYKRYVIALLDYYKIFEGELWGLKDKYIEAFFSNYMYLTTTRTLGYSWESLNDVKDKVDILDTDIIEGILNQYSDNKKSNIQKEQILVLTSKLEKLKSHELQFKHIIKPRFSNKLERNVSKLLNETLVKEFHFIYDWEKIDNKYVDTFRKGSDLIIFESTNELELTFFRLAYEENNFEIKIYANYEKPEVYLEINGVKSTVETVENLVEIVIEKLKKTLFEWVRDKS